MQERAVRSSVRVAEPIQGIFEPLRQELGLNEPERESAFIRPADAGLSRRAAKGRKHLCHFPSSDVMERTLLLQDQIAISHFKELPEIERLALACKCESVISHFHWTMTEYRHVVNQACAHLRNLMQKEPS